MNGSRKKLVSTGNLVVGTPIGAQPISAQGGAEERPASHGQPIVPVAKPKTIVVDITMTEAQRIVPQARLGLGSYAVLDTDFRGHHETNTARRRGPYEHYRLVYRYGYDLGIDPRYCAAEWADVERAARPRWEERNPGTWASFAETIRYAWNQARKFGNASR